MPHHEETRILNHTSDNLFTLVADVGAYPDFLPWCQGARVKTISEQILEAELIIGFGLFRERFTSKVYLDRDRSTIQSQLIKGPFKHLSNDWGFKALSDHQTELRFKVQFEFNSKILQKAGEKFFTQAQRRMVKAFEERATKLYC